MDSLAETDIAQIVTLQRDEGLQRLSSYFSWNEFGGRHFTLHQEFVYDMALFATSRGFSWANVIRAAVAAKNIFPQLHDLSAHILLSLFKDVLPVLTPLQQHHLVQYLTDTFVARRRLFAAVVGGPADMFITCLDVEVDLPPTPCPLEKGTDLHEWETQEHEGQQISQMDH
ncbi:unnamed protein product [Ophioblennius macclurei]